jgi:hypothetical protein
VVVDNALDRLFDVAEPNTVWGEALFANSSRTMVDRSTVRYRAAAMMLNCEMQSNAYLVNGVGLVASGSMW